MSQLGTSDYPPTSTTTSDFTPITPTVSPSLAIAHIGHLQSPPQCPHHFQVHTWAPPITHPISHSGTFDYPPTIADQLATKYVVTIPNGLASHNLHID